MGKFTLTEIDRDLFVSLHREGDKSIYGNEYVILCDLNFRDRFFAESDDKAKEYFYNYIERK